MDKVIEYSNTTKHKNVRDIVSEVLQTKEFRSLSDERKKEYIKELFEKYSEEQQQDVKADDEQ